MIRNESLTKLNDFLRLLSNHQNRDFIGKQSLIVIGDKRQSTENLQIDDLYGHYDNENNVLVLETSFLISVLNDISKSFEKNIRDYDKKIDELERDLDDLRRK